MTMSDEKPLEYFYPKLASSAVVKDTLKAGFGEKSDRVDLLLLEGGELPQEFSSVHDDLYDLVHNDAEVVRGFAAGGSEAGEYPINVMLFEGVYFVEAPQFDDIGYFPTEKDAVKALTMNWIDAYECDD
jgi:hypothetical protein